MLLHSAAAASVLPRRVAQTCDASLTRQGTCGAQAAVAQSCAAHVAGLARFMARLERDQPEQLARVRADAMASPAVRWQFHAFELVHFEVALAGAHKRAKGEQPPAPPAWEQVRPARSGTPASFLVGVLSLSRICRHVHSRCCLCSHSLRSEAPPPAMGAVLGALARVPHAIVGSAH